MSDSLRFLVQLIVIIFVSRLAAYILSKFRQPPVIGEILAGLMLGPCLLGLVAPVAFKQLFPANSLPALNTLSQLGLILFMFLVGLRIDSGHLRAHGRSAAIVSIVSIVVPFAGGAALGLFLRGHLAPPGVSPAAFSFFIGVAMSVTAFPVLARILADTGMIRTPLGVLAIACAAFDDAVAWILLAAGASMAHSGSNPMEWARIVLLLVAYTGFMFLIRPTIKRFVDRENSQISYATLGSIVILAVTSAATTEWIGIHALFGAFFAGVLLPRNREFSDQVAGMLEPVATVILLPIFFAYTGLRMGVPQMDARLWTDAVLILLVAVAGKCGGAAMAGRFAGLSWRDASALGILLNTRGLVELVILNVGLDLGILSPELFSMMVGMALFTTAMTTPLLGMLKSKSEYFQYRVYQARA